RQGADLHQLEHLTERFVFVPIRVGGEYAHADRKYPAQYLARQAQPLHFVEDQRRIQIQPFSIKLRALILRLHGKIPTTTATASSPSSLSRTIPRREPSCFIHSRSAIVIKANARRMTSVLAIP